MENGSENNHGRNDDGKFRKTLLRLIFAAGGLMLLFNGSFFKNQFEDGASLKGMFFIILSLGVGLFVFVPEEYNHKLGKLCNSYFLVNALVKFLLLGLFSMLIFFAKYPALKIQHLEGKRSQKVYDFLGVGSFSLFALLISWERQHGAEGFGVFEFMLELTMDASMDIPAGDGDGSMPNLWYMVSAYVYCFLLLIIRCYRNHSLSTEQHLNDSPSREDSHASGNDHGRASESVNRKVDGLSSEQHQNGLSTEQQLSTEQHQNDSQEGNALTEVGNYQMEGLRSRRPRREKEPAAAAAIRPKTEEGQRRMVWPSSPEQGRMEAMGLELSKKRMMEAVKRMMEAVEALEEEDLSKKRITALEEEDLSKKRMEAVEALEEEDLSKERMMEAVGRMMKAVEALEEEDLSKKKKRTMEAVERTVERMMEAVETALEEEDLSKKKKRMMEAVERMMEAVEALMMEEEDLRMRMERMMEEDRMRMEEQRRMRMERKRMEEELLEFLKKRMEADPKKKFFETWPKGVQPLGPQDKKTMNEETSTSLAREGTSNP